MCSSLTPLPSHHHCARARAGPALCPSLPHQPLWQGSVLPCAAAQGLRQWQPVRCGGVQQQPRPGWRPLCRPGQPSAGAQLSLLVPSPPPVARRGQGRVLPGPQPGGGLGLAGEQPSHGQLRAGCWLPSSRATQGGGGLQRAVRWGLHCQGCYSWGLQRRGGQGRGLQRRRAQGRGLHCSRAGNWLTVHVPGAEGGGLHSHSHEGCWLLLWGAQGLRLHCWGAEGRGLWGGRGQGEGGAPEGGGGRWGHARGRLHCQRDEGWGLWGQRAAAGGLLPSRAQGCGVQQRGMGWGAQREALTVKTLKFVH